MAETAHYPGKELEAMSFAANYHRWIVDEMAPYLGTRVAEVGAGIGSVSKLLLKRPIERLDAFEPSGNMYPKLQHRLRKDARARAIQSFFGAGQAGSNYDSVVYINVLEHIEDDRKELVHAYASLRRGGFLLVFVPALSWLYGELDRQVGHVRRYSGSELRGRVRVSGFDVVSCRYFDIAGVLPWYVNFVLLKRPLDTKSVSTYDRYVVPPMRVLESWVKPPIGKNLLLVARRPQK